jgi:hypothetical protein
MQHIISFDSLVKMEDFIWVEIPPFVL